MTPLSHNPSDDGYSVCYDQDGIKVCAWVSSIHLVQDKEPQLKRAVEKIARMAYLD